MKSALVLLIVALVAIASCEEGNGAASGGKWTKEQVMEHINNKLSGICMNFKCRTSCVEQGHPAGYCDAGKNCVCVPKPVA